MILRIVIQLNTQVTAQLTQWAMMFWTVSEETRLVNMRRQGRSFRFVANTMNRSESEVASKYLQLVPLPGCDICNSSVSSSHLDALNEQDPDQES
jgi:hypothetical protein